MRKFGRIDGNHTEIVKALRSVGCSVLSLASLGNGAPDLLVSRNGRMWLIEVKDGRLAPSKRRLTPDELLFHQKWNGSIHVIGSSEEAIQLITKTHDMNKDEAIKLLLELTDATVNRWRCDDGGFKGDVVAKAQAREHKAIKEVLRHLTPDVIEDSDLALYW